MNEELELIYDATRRDMDKSMDHLGKELLKIRAGRANPQILSAVKLDYYGTQTPLAQVSNINTPDAHTLTVQPWEKGMIPEIEKAILNSGLGFTPQNNGEVVIINIPALTEARRKELVKQVRAEAEHARVGIRNARKEANDKIKKIGKEGLSEDLAKDAEAEVQEITNTYNEKVDKYLTRKEEEIMRI